jgi:hypothetical protein
MGYRLPKLPNGLQYYEERAIPGDLPYRPLKRQKKVVNYTENEDSDESF